MAAMMAVALPGCSSGRGWHWYVAGNSEGLTPCNSAENQVGF
jgi:hypothetical protein